MFKDLIYSRAVVIAYHSAVKEHVTCGNVSEYLIIFSGIKNEKPAELVDTEPSV